MKFLRKNMNAIRSTIGLILLIISAVIVTKILFCDKLENWVDTQEAKMTFVHTKQTSKINETIITFPNFSNSYCYAGMNNKNTFSIGCSQNRRKYNLYFPVDTDTIINQKNLVVIVDTITPKTITCDIYKKEKQ